MKYQLDDLVNEFKRLEMELTNPEIYSDQKKMKDLMIQKKQLEGVVFLYNDYKKTWEDLTEAKVLLADESDEEMRDMMKLEVSENEAKLPGYEEKIQMALLPQDPNDDKNIMLEVRAGTGGDEATLFAQELINSYDIFAKDEGFKVSIDTETRNDNGGIKEKILKVC